MEDIYVFYILISSISSSEFGETSGDNYK